MSNDNVWKSFFDQFSKVLELVREGKRTLEFVSRLLQAVIGDDEIMIRPKQASVAIPPDAPPKPRPEFNVWKIIKLGTGFKTAKDFCRAFKRAGYKIGDWANDVLGQKAFTVTPRETSLVLVRVSVSELGFERATRRKIYARALELGLKLCPAETGPQLRLQYTDQPLGEWVLVGMEPITDSGGDPHVFRVARDEDGAWLDGAYGDAEGVWYGGDRWVFARA